jgi:hypothetical protein
MQPTEQQVQRSLAALLITGAPHGATNGDNEDQADGLHTELCWLDDVPTEVFTRMREAPALRPDRLEQARRRLECGEAPTAEDLAERMIGRLVCDRLR